MARIEQLAEGVTLYLGDCLEVLPTLDAVGCMITDPPYGMGYKSGHATKALWAGEDIEGDETTFIRDYALHWARRLPVLCFGTWKIERPGRTKIVLIWDKGGALGMGDLAIPWKADHEEIYVIGSGFVGTRDTGSVLRHSPVQSTAKNGRLHPNEKPLSLMHDLIRKTSGRIADPFMGSGSTGVAAVQAGREFVGIEMVESYFDAACRRIEAALSEPSMFIQPPKPPKQEAFI